MPLPLWISLATLAAATARSESMRPVNGPPLRKSIFDMMRRQPEFEAVVKNMMTLLRHKPDLSFVEAQRYLAHSLGLDMSHPTIGTTANMLYMCAQALTWNATWSLDEEATLMLANTDVPWHIVQNRLPRLPVPAMHIRLPDGISIPVDMRKAPKGMKTKSVPDMVPLRSILLLEEEPGEKWRYLGSSDDPVLANFSFTNGWLDTREASIRAQLEGQVRVDPGFAYTDSGEDKVWAMLINLMLALENDHLEGQKVEPRTSRNKKRAARERKRADYSPYTVVRLSGGSSGSTSRGPSKPTGATVRRHLRSGHWRSSWVLDPGERPVYATKPRLGRDGRELEGKLYQVMNWIFPTWVGEGEISLPKNVRVKK